MEANYAGKVYVGQTDLTIRLETKKPLEVGTTCAIRYKGPTTQSGDLVATIYDAEKGIIQRIVGASGPFIEAGTWILWAVTTNVAGLISIGEPVPMIVYAQGK